MVPVIVSRGGGHTGPGKEDVTPIAPASKRPGEPRADVPRAERDARMGALVAAHFDAVWRAVKRLGVPAGGVDDAAQEVFIVAARKLADIEVGRERGYLLGVAVRVASDARRAARRRGEIALEAVPSLTAPRRRRAGVARRRARPAAAADALGRCWRGCRKRCARCSSCSRSRS